MDTKRGPRPRAGIRTLLVAVGALFVALPHLSACQCDEVNALPGGPPDQPRYLAIGDSILASHHAGCCQSIPDHAALAIGRYIRNKAVVGQPLTHAEGGGDITAQYESGPWEWVVMTGGANDLRLECDCLTGDGLACDAVVDSLVTAEGDGGHMVNLLATILADPAHEGEVLLVSYYPFGPGAAAGWGRCEPWIDEIERRYESLAAREPRVSFYDASTVMDYAAHPEYFYGDHVHPSFDGAAAVGQDLASILGAR